MSDPPLVPGALHGLRTWRVVGEAGGERLAGPQRQSVTWPTGGAWLEAVCGRAATHPAPGRECSCGVHAWHPRRRWARRMLAVRREIPGVVEARGAVEVHEDGFRAERARPQALLLARGRDPRLVRRLAEAYAVPVVEVGGPDAVLEWCRERGLGLGEAVVAELIGGPGARRRTRRDALRLAAAVGVVATLLAAGLAVTGPPGDRVLFGRTGEVRGGR